MTEHLRRYKIGEKILFDIAMVEDSASDSYGFDSDRSSSIADLLDEFDLPEKRDDFLFDERLQKLICIGTNFDAIPQAIIDEYAHRTKVRGTTTKRWE